MVNYVSRLVLFISFALAATAQLQTIFDGTGKLVPSVGTPVGPTANTSRQIQLGLRLLF